MIIIEYMTNFSKHKKEGKYRAVVWFWFVVINVVYDDEIFEQKNFVTHLHTCLDSFSMQLLLRLIIIIAISCMSASKQ